MKEPDVIWDAVCGAFGLKPVTRAEKSRVGRVVRDLRAKGVTPDLVRIQADRYKLLHPDWGFTPEAVLKHWDQVAHDMEMSFEPRAMTEAEEQGWLEFLRSNH